MAFVKSTFFVNFAMVKHREAAHARQMRTRSLCSRLIAAL